MLYYKVPARLDGKRLYKPGPGPRVSNGYELIAGELLTEKEGLRINAPLQELEKVSIPKTKTYHFFGARFADE